MFKLIYLIICLLILSYIDVKSRAVPVWWLIVMGAVIPVAYVCDYTVCGERIDYKQLVIAIIIAITFVLLSVLTSMIGEADGIVIGYVCILSNVYIAIAAIIISFVILAASGGVLILLKRARLKSALPYMPFLTSAYVLTIILGR